jgi:hypothetical protein
MKTHLVIRTTVAAAGSMLLAGCWTSRPLEVAVPQPQTRVIAQVTDSGAVALGNTIGAGALEVEGVVTEATPDAWKLQVLRVDDKFGASNVWQRQVITFPRYSLTRPRVKQLDKRRSWIAAGGIVLGAVAAARIFGGIIVGEDPDPNPNPPPATLVLPGGIFNP